jgi:hypothetical protein
LKEAKVQVLAVDRAKRKSRGFTIFTTVGVEKLLVEEKRILDATGDLIEWVEESDECNGQVVLMIHSGDMELRCKSDKNRFLLIDWPNGELGGDRSSSC